MPNISDGETCRMLMEPQSTRFDLKWTLFNVACRVHPFFWLITLGLGFTAGGFDMTLLWVACVFFSILVHEYGHALTSRHYGARQVRIVLYMLGGLAITEARLTRRQRVFMLLWGPGAGFVLAGMVFLGFGGAYGFGNALSVTLMSVGFDVARDAGAQAVGQMGFYPLMTLYFLMRINLIWGLVNLLPIYPLDGGQLAREWYTMKRGERGISDSLRFSMWFCIVMAGLYFVFATYQRIAYGAKDPDLGPPIFFGIMAYICHSLNQPRFLEAQREQHREHNTPRQPWEQDPDWWKGGG